MNNTKKLLLYCLDCVRSCEKSSVFNNLKNNKDNKIMITDATEFESDNKDIIDLMVKHALNKSTMAIYYGTLMLEGQRGRDRFYSPLLYCEAELIRVDDKIKLVYDPDNMIINIGLISSLLDNDADVIENVINQLLEIDHPEQIDFKKVLTGLINLDGLAIKEQKTIILSKVNESIAGLVNELKVISELY